MDVSGQPVSARARSRLATRARLLASARRLFARHGLHGVTTHDIARGAEVAAGTFYLHFKDKEEVFREIVYDAIEILRQRLRAAIAATDDTTAAVRAHAEAMVSFAEEHRDLIRIVFGRDHAAAAIESDVLDRLAAGAAEVRRARMAEGIFPADLDPDVVAQALTGMFTRVVVWWIEDPSRAPRERVVETLTRIQLGGTYVANVDGTPGDRAASPPEER